ncbi:MAG: 3-oxoacyl-[acyl-carrier-protein] reductase [Alistipes sp.]|nr:3-oxoacyl-[acyl-carrier-protein] reductase [Alistipes sp.]MBP3550641.1 3-oxoacyl-[acyl-carrier-protein] reductase [Alistipes sp.]
MKLLEGKVALVTGATRGIGRAIALKFAEHGANIAFTYLSSVAAAESLVAEIEALGVRAVGFASNAADFAGAHEVVEKVVAEFGQIDILVNNAGQTKDGLMLRMSEEQWDSIIDTNLKSAFNFTHAVTPAMARKRAGSIINMSSVVGTNGNAGQCNYAASKAGLIGLTMSMAKEMGARGIRCNAIAPGFIETDMTDKLNDATKQAIISSVSLGRMGTVDEIANVALFLASDMSSYISGEVIKVTGCMKG